MALRNMLLPPCNHTCTNLLCIEFYHHFRNRTRNRLHYSLISGIFFKDGYEVSQRNTELHEVSYNYNNFYNYLLLQLSTKSFLSSCTP